MRTIKDLRRAATEGKWNFTKFMFSDITSMYIGCEEFLGKYSQGYMTPPYAVSNWIAR